MNNQPAIPLHAFSLKQALDCQPLIVSLDQKVAEVATLMEKTGKNYALVQENQQLVGILTEKSLVELAVRGVPLTEAALASVMTKNPLTIPLNQLQDLASVSSLWQQNQITHLPIIDGKNRPVGVITTSSFLSSLLNTIPIAVPLPQTTATSPLNCVGLAEFQTMFKALSEAVILADTHLRIQMLNPAALNLFSYQPTEIIGQPTAILYASEAEYERQGRRRFNLSAAEQRERYEVNYRRRNGEEFIGETVGTVVKGDTGEIIGFLAIIRDLTQQKQTERQLQNTEYLMQKISEATPNLFYIYDLQQQRNIYTNRELADALGYSPEAIADMGREIYTHLFHPEELERISAHHQQIADTKEQELFEIEYRVRHVNGQWLWFYSWEVVFCRNKLGWPTQILGTTVNITRRKQLEQELERFFSLSLDLFCVAGTDGYFKRLNPAFEKVLGSTQEELLSQPFINFVHPDDIKATLAEIDKLTQGLPTVSFENRYRCRDGDYKWLAWKAFPIPEEEIIYAVARDFTEYKQVESALRESQERLQAIIDNTSNVIYLKDIQGRYLLINHQYEKLFHRTREQIIGQMDSQIFPTEIAEAFRNNDRQILAVGKSLEFEETAPQDDGLHTYISIKFPLWDSQGKAYGVCGISTDITERHRAEEAIRQNEQRFRALIENATDIIIILDNQFHFRYLSPSVRRILGYAPEELIDQSFWTMTDPEEKHLLTNCLNCALNQPGISQSSIEYHFYTRQGTGRILEAVITNLLNNPAVQGIVLNCHEITDRKQAEVKLQHDALHDSLTNLPNRALLMERIKQALQRQQRHPKKLLGVLFLDLDRFKVINDSLGHLVGDRLLIALAARLEECKRVSDTVARLGGDEFVFLLEELTSPESAIKIAERIHQVLEKPFLLNNKELFVSASIGIALSTNPHDYLDPTQLLRDADTAMYKAKERGKSCHAIFEPAMHTQALRLLRLENDLRRAIAREELVVYYQPIVSLETNELEGVEALVRWQHPEQGLILPADFIPMAEETGIIIALDQWLLKKACRQLRSWQQQFPASAHLTLSVNFSGNHFDQRDCLEQVDQILAATGILGKYLKLEITESVLLSNPDSTSELLKQLRERNIQVCLDDFGTGYSSLSYLHRFSLNILKIDRSFVNTLEAEESRMAIVRTIVTLGHELGIEVIAEGIETIQQLQFLQALGCHYGQGYYFSPPVDSKALTALLSASTPLA